MSKERIPRIGTRAHPLENAVDAGERAKNALVRSKTVVEKQTGRDESSPNEYAEHEIQYAAEDSTLAARRLAVNQGRKLVHRGRETLHEPEQEEPQQPFGETPCDTPAPQTRVDPMQPAYRHDEQPIPRTMEPVVPDESEKPIRQTAQRGKMSSGEPSSSNPAQKQMLIRERTKPDGAATSAPIQHNAMREQPDTLLSDTPASEKGKELAQKTIRSNVEAAKRAELPMVQKRSIEPRQSLQAGANEIKKAERPTRGMFASPTIKSKTDMKRPQAYLRSAAKMQNDVQAVQQTARAAASAAQKAAIVSHGAEKATERASKSVVKAFVRAVNAAAKAALDATRELIVSIAAGEWVVLVAIIVVCLIGAFIASPFGILFSNEPTPGGMPLNVAVGQLNMELSDTLEALQDGDYDSIDIQGESPDWREVVAVFASKTAGAHDGVDVAALTPDRVDRLKAVFWDMCVINSEVETIDHPGEGEDEGWTEYILHITITAKTAEEMRTEYAFTSYQNEALTELLAELEPMKLLLTDLSVSQEQARALVANLPDDLAPERRAVVETACQLVGKVSYYWGGKSLVLGWDSRWGQIQKVTAEGNSTTGTYRPYGLDCSGFVDWVFYNASGGAYVLGHGGGAAMQHSYCTPISWENALPGDLVFYPDDEHVGIVGGWDEAGELLIVHCASSYNCAVITAVSGFTNAGRPDYYSD